MKIASTIVALAGVLMLSACSGPGTRTTIDKNGHQTTEQLTPQDND